MCSTPSAASAYRNLCDLAKIHRVKLQHRYLNEDEPNVFAVGGTYEGNMGCKGIRKNILINTFLEKMEPASHLLVRYF